MDFIGDQAVIPIGGSGGYGLTELRVEVPWPGVMRLVLSQDLCERGSFVLEPAALRELADWAEQHPGFVG